MPGAIAIPHSPTFMGRLLRRRPTFGLHVLAAIVPLTGGAALRLAGDGIAVDLPWGMLLPAVLAMAIGLGWLPAAALVCGSLLAWPGHILTLLGFSLAAGAQIAAVEAIRASLRNVEREAGRLEALVADGHAMLGEMQHRMANALQFHASLLSLQAERIDDAEIARGALRDAAARLGTVAKVHRRLHDTPKTGAELTDLLRSVAADTLATRGLDTGLEHGVRLTATVGATAGALDAARATSVAMIVTEATTNAAKHAFEATGHGHLGIALDRRGPDFVLTITDDGPGPPDAPGVSGSLGLTVMQAMARRLSGSFRFGRAEAGGAKVVVVFPAHVSSSG